MAAELKAGVAAPIAVDCDVLVLGAGAAGIGAAVELGKAGIKAIVLEARDRLGGRVHTTRAFAGAPIDLGGKWIHHSCRHNPMYTYAKSNKLLGHEYKTKPKGEVYIDSDTGEVYDSEAFGRAEKAAKKVLGKVEDLKLETGDISVEQALTYCGYEKALKKLDAISQKIFEAEIQSVAGYEGGSLTELGTAGYQYDNKELPGADNEVACGYGELIQRIAKEAKVDVRLGEKAVSVTSADKKNELINSGVLIETVSGKQYKAKCVVVSLPLGVLQTEDVNFSPSLPQQFSRSLDALRMGTVGKVVLHFEGPFSPRIESRDGKEKKKGSFKGKLEDVEYFWVIGPAHKKFEFFVNWRPMTGENIWVGYAHPDYGKTFEEANQKAILDDAMSVIVKAFLGQNPKDVPKLKKSLITNWSKDTLSRGAYTFVPVGGKFSDVEQLAKGLPERGCMFAGEHTSVSGIGTVHGAYMSGVRAASQAKTLLNA
mmetsp:Transcript_11244/g.27649  ORF Transcript_11244/g.27649 Transcript_11244/m.27649 type:complete len:483 (-) Transcript_11244:204-1652(-)